MPSDMELYLEKILKRTNPDKYIEILEQDRKDFAQEIKDLQTKIDKATKDLQELIDKVDNKTIIGLNEFIPKLEIIQDELVGDKE